MTDKQSDRCVTDDLLLMIKLIKIGRNPEGKSINLCCYNLNIAAPSSTTLLKIMACMKPS